ncbi:MAG: hypothetical protein IJ335_11810 [Lachnospiraceae bacterium]|nr:hypothetical protein [Lachnospiraceae bacterium]
MLRRIRNAAILLFTGVLVGTLLLTLAFCLPVDRIRENVKVSLYHMLEVRSDEEGDERRKEWLSLKENFTESLMVQNAFEQVEGKNPFEHAMYIYHYDLSDGTTWATEESLSLSLKEGTEGMHLREYSKYWHGYLIFLKPLLMMMSWSQLEIFWMVFMLGMTAVTALMAMRKKEPLLGLGVLLAFLFMKPLRIIISVDLSICWLVTLISILVLLQFYQKLQARDWLEGMFIIIGMVTSYMDFLTYPVVTLVFPLCTLLVLAAAEQWEWKNSVLRLFWICVSWAGGYIGMWGMKWVVAELTLQTGTLRNAAWSVITRTEPLDGHESFASGISRTFDLILDQYDRSWYSIVFLLIIIAVIISLVVVGLKKQMKQALPVLVCALAGTMIPMVWLALTQNHSAIHCWFTFRVLGASVFGVWCMGIISVKKSKYR